MDNKQNSKMSTLESYLWSGAFVLCFVGLMLVIGNSGNSDATGYGTLLIILGAASFVGAIIARKNRHERKPYVQKPIEEMTEAEKQQMLVNLEILYKRGEIPFLGYNIMKSKLTGTKSMTDIMGFEAAAAAGHKLDVDRAVQKLAKDNERAVILGSAIGHGIGGLGSSIVGGLSAAAQGNAEMAELLEEQARADEVYREALHHSGEM